MKSTIRSFDLAHLALLFPSNLQSPALAVVTLLAIAAVLALAWRRRGEFQPTAAVIIAGGVLAAPHALPADLVVVALAMAVWGKTRWYEWLALSVVA